MYFIRKVKDFPKVSDQCQLNSPNYHGTVQTTLERCRKSPHQTKTNTNTKEQTKEGLFSVTKENNI